MSNDDEEEVIEVTVDSGAVNTVGPPDVGKAFETYETEASRTGKNFKAANGSPILNYGEKRITGDTDDGRKIQMRMTVCRCRKSPYVCNKGV